MEVEDLGHHISKRFNEDLEHVRNSVLAMGGLVEEQLDRAIKAKNQKEIERLDGVLREFLKWADRFPQPTIVKVATGLRGLKTGPRPIPLSPDKESLLAEFREWFKDWLPAVKKMSANA